MIPWVLIMVGGGLLAALVALVLVVRSRTGRRPLTPEERREMASAPMAPLQKRAWLGVAITGVTLLIIAAIIYSQGAMTYWEDDALRLRVVFIFIGGLLAYTLLPLGGMLRAELKGEVDERDQAILARSSMAQSTGVLLALAAWMVSLGQMFHDEGAVPMVYLYLIFGSTVLVNMFSQSLGILLGYWFGVGDGQG